MCDIGQLATKPIPSIGALLLSAEYSIAIFSSQQPVPCFRVAGHRTTTHDSCIVERFNTAPGSSRLLRFGMLPMSAILVAIEGRTSFVDYDLLGQGAGHSHTRAIHTTPI